MNSLEFIEKRIKFLEDMIFMDLALLEDEEDLEDIAEKQKELNILQQIKTEIEEYQKLKDKETSRKVLNKHKEYCFPSAYRLSGICPNCKNHVDESKYCSRCGQKLDWGDENA